VQAGGKGSARKGGQHSELIVGTVHARNEGLASKGRKQRGLWQQEIKPLIAKRGRAVQAEAKGNASNEQGVGKRGMSGKGWCGRSSDVE
jgi:hypothetical protein